MARADPMTTHLSQAFGGLMQSQMESNLLVWISSLPDVHHTYTFNTSADPNRRSLAFVRHLPPYLRTLPARSPNNALNSKLSTAQRIALLRRRLPRAQQSAALGPVSILLGQVAEHDKPPTRNLFAEQRLV